MFKDQLVNSNIYREQSVKHQNNCAINLYTCIMYIKMNIRYNKITMCIYVI